MLPATVILKLDPTSEVESEFQFGKPNPIKDFFTKNDLWLSHFLPTLATEASELIY